jgi:hypothetical protein
MVGHMMPRRSPLWVICLIACNETEAPEPTPPACDTNEVAFLIDDRDADTEHGELGGMMVPVQYEGALAYLAVDTGSALTFLYLGDDGPDYVREAGVVQLGCESLTLPGRGFSSDDTRYPIVGVFGADLFITQHGELDLEARTLTRHLDGSRPAVPDSYAELAFENALDHALIHVTVDGTDLRLMWDTGSPHLLWVGVEGRQDDEVGLAQDVEGNTFPIYSGPSEVSLASEPATTLRVMRAPEFPYFADTVEALGGNIQGLAGQSTLGARRIVFDPEASLMHLGPR